jgi:zinc protease
MASTRALRRSGALALSACLLAALPLGCRGAAAPAGPAQAASATAATAPAGPATGEALPFNPAVRRAQLPNRLTYYVRKNARPGKRAVLWLVVNTGSVLENDDQRGLAHFIEHMAFNGTRRYAKQQIVQYLQSIGMRFGADINAFTTFDETVFQLEVPTDDAALDRGVDILHEWAQGIAFDPDEVQKERGVVLEERRLGRGAQGRLLDAVVPAALPGSKYGARLPIGTEEVLKRATADDLRRFYREWYRPELMAVVAVGDFDPAAMDKRIAARFADLPAAAHPRTRPELPVPPHASTVALTLKDPELPVTAVAVVAKRPRRVLATERDYRQSLIDRLFITMLNQRLDELRRAADSPFLGAGVGRETVVRPIDAWFQFAVVKGDQIRPSLEALTAEVARVARFGFTAGEIDRAKKDMLRGYQQAAHEEDKSPSRAHAAEIQRHFLLGEAMPGIAAEKSLVERLLPSVTGEEIRRVAAEVSSEESRIIVAAGHASAKLPPKSELIAAAAAGRARATSAYVDQAAGGDLLERAPAPGKVERERKLGELAATEWRLSNGVTVVLKPTDFQNDQVLMQTFTPGGTSRASDADFLSARAAAEVAAASGFGQYSAVQLQKRLAGSGVSSEIAFHELGAVSSGTAPADGLEQLLQLTYLELSGPRRDEKAFRAWRAQAVDALRNQLASPEIAFDHRFASEASGGHLRRRRLNGADMEKVDLDRALAFYRQSFASMRGTTVVLVGAFDVQKVKPLVLAYLGGLPGGHAAPRWRDVHVQPPRGRVRFEVKQGIEAKATVKLEFHGRMRWSREAEHDLQALSDALSERLREELREEMGGVYGVDVDADLRRDPAPEYDVTIEFGCAPENVDRLLERTRAEIEAFRKSGPPAAVVDKMKAADRREHETALKENGFWVSALTDYYRLGIDPRLILDHDRLVDRVSPKALQSLARRVFGPDEVLGVLLPR